MTKKTGLADTLKQKKNLDMDTLTQNVNKLHSEEQQAKKVSQEHSENLQKFQVFLPKETHKKIKLYCTEQDLNIKDFCADAIMAKANELQIL